MSTKFSLTYSVSNFWYKSRLGLLIALLLHPTTWKTVKEIIIYQVLKLVRTLDSIRCFANVTEFVTSVITIFLKPLPCSCKIVHVGTIVLIRDSSVYTMSIRPVFIAQGTPITFINVCAFFLPIRYSNPGSIGTAGGVSQNNLGIIYFIRQTVDIPHEYLYSRHLDIFLIEIWTPDYLQMFGKNKICFRISGLVEFSSFNFALGDRIHVGCR